MFSTTAKDGGLNMQKPPSLFLFAHALCQHLQHFHHVRIAISGKFDRYKQEANLDRWEGFPELMWSLGFDMDSGHSFDEYKKQCGLSVKPAFTEREQKRNTLYLLEHANIQIVGNYLFSEWRYFTHWAYRYGYYDVDFLWRIIAALESKLENHGD